MFFKFQYQIFVFIQVNQFPSFEINFQPTRPYFASCPCFRNETKIQLSCAGFKSHLLHMSDKQTDRQTIVQIILLSGWFWFFDLSRSSNEIAITTFAFKVRLKQPASYQINTQQTDDERTKGRTNEETSERFKIQKIPKKDI